MSIALYNKYRPKTMEDIRGQSHVKRILCNQIRSDEVSHAYLFTGPAGTGKTTCARLLAAMVNCSSGQTISPPPNDRFVSTILSGNNSSDVYEIDAATNGGIDNIRKIRQEAYFSPIEMRKKIYIIDECHRLSSAAWEGLLKIMEEPPSHVIFILCTTAPQEVIDTVKTRCMILDFKPLMIQDIVAEIKRISSSESIQIEEEAIRAIASCSRGSARQAITWLGHLRDDANGGKITVDVVSNGIGIIPRNKARDFIIAVLNKRFIDGLKASSDVLSQGMSGADEFLSNIALYCHDIMLYGARDYDWIMMGYSQSEVDELADIKRLIEEKLPGVDYRILASCWIKIIEACYKITVFNMQQQFQIDVCFVEMVTVSSTLAKSKKEAS